MQYKNNHKMAKLLSEGGIRYLEELRSPNKDDTEAKKIAVELPDVPLLIQEDNPCKWDLVFVCSDGIVYGHRLGNVLLVMYFEI